MAVILVVDDDESIRGLVSMVLNSAGHKIVTAANGAEAVAVYRSFTSQIDLVITDLNMPTMDGVQEILRIRMTNPDARFICMTGDSADRCPEGVVLLNKPFAITELLSCVDHMLRPSAPNNIPRRHG
jgi:two-component system, cell cycle sensor histidine kinase and response regulator CckA